MNSFIRGLIHYYIGTKKLRRCEYGWVVAEWHFLLAREYLSNYLYPIFLKGYDEDAGTEKAGVLSSIAYRYALKCGQLLTMIEELNAKRLRKLERKAEMTCWARRIRREAARNNGDYRKSNVALFLTYPE